MQTHNLSKSHGRKHRRIGRGGKRGSFSGRGIKGQKARAGRRIRPQIRDIIKKIHKQKGQRRGHFYGSIKQKPAIVNLRDLEKAFANGDKVTPKTLLEKGLLPGTKKELKRIKILGAGELKKKLSFDKDLFMSDAVKQKLKLNVE